MLAAACGSPTPRARAVSPDPAGGDAAGDASALRLRLPEPGERASLLQLHMADRYADLRLMERALVEGELEEVRGYATALALDRTDPELAAWSAELAAMRAAAGALASAPDVPTASRREPALAATCGGCHVAAGAQLPFADDGPPDDDGSTRARMARHQWAADRLWQALVAPSSAAWRDGLAVFGATPLPVDELAPDTDVATRQRIGDLARRFQDLATASRPAQTLRARADAYGELLVVCASCHALAH